MLAHRLIGGITFTMIDMTSQEAARVDASSAEVSPSEDLFARAEQLRTVIASSPQNLGAGILGATIMAVAAWRGQATGSTPLIPMSWWLLLIVGLIRGIWICKSYDWSSSDEATVYYGRRLIFNGAYCSILWGGVSWSLLPTVHVGIDSFLIIATAMVLFGGGAAQGIYPAYLKIFVYPTVAIFLCGLVKIGNLTGLMLGVAFPILTFVIVSAANIQSDAVRQAAVFRLREKRLREQAEESRQAAEFARVRADSAREDAERARVDAELARTKADHERFAAVSAHRASEDSRLAAELATNELIKQRRSADLARHEAESAKEAAELARVEAERANGAKTAFLAAASHDLRQPMHALVTYVGYLRRKNKDGDLHDILERCGKSLESMEDLLNSILEVSKIITGKVKPAITSFKIDNLISRIDAQVRPLAEDKGLELISENSSLAVVSDEILLERILRNLILNAIRYTPKGRIAIRVKHFGENLQVFVHDTGIGIAKRDIPRIFEEFYQVENDARNRRKGLGLGLTIVRQLCDLLGHKVQVRSIRGKGSSFVVQIPLSSTVVDGRLVQAGLERVDYIRGSNVILIDDNEESLAASSLTLSELGCHVFCASSGLDAIERLQGQEFALHLIVSDYRLGSREDGIDAIRLVTENQQALFGDDYKIPAVIISGDTAPQELMRIQEAGYAMLHKPVSMEVMRETIGRLLRQFALAE